jgi:hypothetical protein
MKLEAPDPSFRGGFSVPLGQVARVQAASLTPTNHEK